MANKPVTYPKSHNLLETDLFQEVVDFVQAKHPKQAKASSVLKNVFGMRLGPAKARRKSKQP